MLSNPELWDKLEAFDFDILFQPLEDEQSWSPAYVRQGLSEYQKFIYLTQISDKEITPSAHIDAIWHVHLRDADSYWHDLCSDVLGRDLHHIPCLSPADMPRYERQYNAAKSLYRREFGSNPPTNLWPTRSESEDYIRLIRYVSRRGWVYAGILGVTVASIAFLPVGFGTTIAVLGIASVVLAHFGFNRLISNAELIGPGLAKYQRATIAKGNQATGAGGCGGCGGG